MAVEWRLGPGSSDLQLVAFLAWLALLFSPPSLSPLQSHGSLASANWTLIANLKSLGTPAPFVPNEGPGSADKMSGSHS